MPAQYERIRDSYIARGKSVKQANKLTAMTYNAHRQPGTPPVGPHSDGVMSKRTKKAVGRHLKRAIKTARGRK